MRRFATSYLIFAAVVLGLLFVLQLPHVLLYITILTMGIGYLLILPAINFGVWIVIFAPAAAGAWLNWRIGAAMAAATLGLAVTFPAWVSDPTRDGMALLEPPFAASGPVAVRSVEITTSSDRRFDAKTGAGPAVAALKRNTDLDWIRVGGTVYERKDGVLHKARRSNETLWREADVIIKIPTRRLNPLWRNAPLSPWRVNDASGYLILDAQTGKPLARNLTLKVERAVRPFMLNVTGVSMTANSNPKIEFHRAPYGEVTQDPDQTLESDMKTLGLWRESAEPAPAPEDTPQDSPAGAAEPVLVRDNPTDSPADAVDAALEKILADRELLPARGFPSRSLTDFERQVIADFNEQMAARVGIGERIDLIARVERSELKRVDRELIIEVAAETPALMSHMVDLYYTDLLSDDRHYGRWERVAGRIPGGHLPVVLAPNTGYAPFARAIGSDRERFLMALGAGKTGKRAFLIGNIFQFGVENPYAILRTLFLPSPPGDPLEARFVQGYRAEWKEQWRREEILKNLRSGWEADKSDKQEEADMAIRLLLSHKDVPRDVLISFVGDWVMTRRSAILHDYKVLLEVLDGLEKAGAEELRANLLTYFADFIEYRPHWMDAPA